MHSVVVLGIYGYFNYEGILVNEKLMALMVGCLSFGAVQAMKFLDPRGDLNPGDLERNITQWIEAYVERDLEPFTHYRDQAFEELKRRLKKYLGRCTPDKLDIYRPCLVDERSNKEEEWATLSLKTSAQAYINYISNLPGDTTVVVSRLREIEVILDEYQPVKVPGKTYEPERQPYKDGDSSFETEDSSSRLWYYLTRVGVPVALAYGVYRVFFAEQKKSAA